MAPVATMQRLTYLKRDDSSTAAGRGSVTSPTPGMMRGAFLYCTYFHTATTNTLRSQGVTHATCSDPYDSKRIVL